jgi:MFS family permease
MTNIIKHPALLVYATAFTGILYGYNIGATSGLVVFLRDALNLSTSQAATLVGSFLTGVFVMLMFMPKVHSILSRKHILSTAVCLSIFASILMAITEHTQIIICSRFFMGLSSGMITATAPLYIVEAIPSGQRGRATVTFQLSLCFGILIASIFSYLLAHSHNWKLLVLGELPFSISLLIVLNYISHSPRWLYRNGKTEDCLKTLEQTHSPHEVEQIVQLLQKEVVKPTKLTWKLVKKHVKPILMTFGLCSLNQLVGINIILQYDAHILVSAGFTKHSLAFLASVFVTLINFFVTLLAFYLSDKIERKFILRLGLLGVFLSLVCVFLVESLLPQTHYKGIIVTTLLSIYVVCFAIAPGALIWGVAAEILPSALRSNIQPIALSLGSLNGALLSFSYLFLEHLIGMRYIFLLFAFFSTLYLALTYRLPKTNNTILENINTNK